MAEKCVCHLKNRATGEAYAIKDAEARTNAESAKSTADEARQIAAEFRNEVAGNSVKITALENRVDTLENAGGSGGSGLSFEDFTFNVTYNGFSPEPVRLPDSYRLSKLWLIQADYATSDYDGPPNLYTTFVLPLTYGWYLDIYGNRLYFEYDDYSKYYTVQLDHCDDGDQWYFKIRAVM